MPPKSQKLGKAASGKGSKEAPPTPAPNERGGGGKQSNSKGSKVPTAAGSSEAASKKPAKMSKEEERLLRQQEQDAMLVIPLDDALGGMEEEADERPRRAAPVDAFGNTLSKAAAAKQKEDARVEALRAEARARREAKQQADAAPAEEHVFAKVKAAASVEELRAKLASGAKLSHKESKLLQRADAAEAEEADLRQEAAEGLGSFSLAFQSERGQDGDGTMSAVDITVSGLTITAPSKALLVDASLRLVRGKRYGLLGPNGKGKTTLLKFLAARRLPVPDGVDVLLVQQEVSASDDSVVNQVLAADKTRARLLSEEQELLAAFEAQGEAGDSAWSEEQWAAQLARFAEVGQQLDAAGADAAESSVRRILTGLGFSEAMQDGPSVTLSGGWRMRVALASALFIEPKLLCLDEPTNHLDLNAVLWLEEYLSTNWEGKSVVVVSHDAAFLEEICTDIIHLDSCKLNYYSGSYWAFAGMHDQIEAKKVRDYNAEQKLLVDLKKTGLTVEKAEKKALQKLGKAVFTEKPLEYRVAFTFQSPEERGPAAELRDVSFSYPGARGPLFARLTAKIDTYSRVSIVGPNGAGKSSLLRLFTGALQPTSGEVLSHSRIRIGCYHQHFEELLNFDVSPVEYLTSTYGVPETTARKYLGMFGLDGPRHLIRIRELSGGQKARVVFASLSLQTPHILVLDEPTNHLDMESVEALITGINNFNGGVVIVSHDSRLIEATQCELWVCGDSDCGLRVEKRGFEQYRRDVMADIRRRADEAAARAAGRARARRTQKEAAVAKIRSKRPVR